MVTATITGTVVSSANEQNVVDGGRTIIITLGGNAFWVAILGANNSATQALIDGLDSDKSETLGWNLIVRDTLTFAAVTRNSNRIVTIQCRTSLPIKEISNKGMRWTAKVI